MCCAHVAQLVEHFLGKEEVTDSSSVMGSMFLLCELGCAKIRMTEAKICMTGRRACTLIFPMQTWRCQDLHDGQGSLHPYFSYANLALGHLCELGCAKIRMTEAKICMTGRRACTLAVWSAELLAPPGS